MAKVFYTDAVQWLMEVDLHRQTGHLVLLADEPRDRTLGYCCVDDECLPLNDEDSLNWNIRLTQIRNNPPWDFLREHEDFRQWLFRREYSQSWLANMYAEWELRQPPLPCLVTEVEQTPPGPRRTRIEILSEE